MADQTLPIPGSFDAAPSRSAALLEWLHSWVVTVDHKKLGILYVVYALFFLLVGGAEAIAIRIQLAVPNSALPLAGNLQRVLHHARHHDGLSRGHADSVRLRELPGAADDRRARHGVPAPECIQLLDDGVRRPASLFQLHRRLWSLRHGQRARRRLVGLCAAHRKGILRPGTIPTTGRWRSSSVDSARWARPSISSQRSSPCAAAA